MATVVGMLAEDMTLDDIRGHYPQLAVADVQQALRYAAAAVSERELALPTAG